MFFAVPPSLGPLFVCEDECQYWIPALSGGQMSQTWDLSCQVCFSQLLCCCFVFNAKTRK